MKKLGLLIALLAGTFAHSHAEMGAWTSHLAYGNTSQIAIANRQIFALADGALYAIDLQDEQVIPYTKQDGLNGSDICQIGYDANNDQLVILYSNGLIDLMSSRSIYSIQDLLLKSMTTSKRANNILIKDGKVYATMPFGIIVINLKRKEILDTYYIGKNGGEVNVKQVAILNNRLYAISDKCLYSCDMADNLLDFSRWKSTPFTSDTLSHMVSYDGKIYLLKNRCLSVYQNDTVADLYDWNFTNLCGDDNHLYAMTHNYVYHMVNGQLEGLKELTDIQQVQALNGQYWMAGGGNGVERLSANGELDFFRPEGPLVNNPYRMKFEYGKLYIVPGGRWASQYNTNGQIMIYDGHQWTNIPYSYIAQACQQQVLDFMNVAIDPLNHDHFFVTSYGTGLYEFNQNQLVKHYTQYNSPLVTLVEGVYADFYIRTDCGMYDADGNYWLMNVGHSSKNIQIIKPSDLIAAHQQDSSGWYGMGLYNSNREFITINTPQEMFMDSRNPNYKWIPLARSSAGIVLLDDKGTPFRSSDDVTACRTSFVDGDGNTLIPEQILSVAQDKNGDLWVGMDKGIFVIPSSVNFFTSNRCERIKIPRNDGTNLADYLLNTERINAIAVDGSNRKWIGTGNGLYLMSEDGIETIEHFTTNNSPIPSDVIVSLAIDPATGLIYVGTDQGLMSYQSDASEPQADFSNIYAYPNPVRPDFDGMITITGLMEGTIVHIVDNGGNLVCETRSNGGLAVWDGKTTDGRRAASGIYTVLCNTIDGGKNKAVTKIMIMH